MTAESEPVLTEIDRTECLELISPGGIGRIAFVGRDNITVLPLNYRFVDGAVLFRTARSSLTDEDLRTGIANAEYNVAFEVDEFDKAAREGWSVLIQGPAHHIDSDAERPAAQSAGVESWPGGERDHFIRITAVRVTGRRIRRSS